MKFVGVRVEKTAKLNSFGSQALRGSEEPAYHTLKTGPKSGESIVFGVPFSGASHHALGARGKNEQPAVGV